LAVPIADDCHELRVVASHALTGEDEGGIRVAVPHDLGSAEEIAMIFLGTESPNHTEYDIRLA
jgi:hypothetical protein